MSDNVFSVPETLISIGSQYSQKAGDVLTLLSSIESFSQTLHDSLTDASARYAIDTFWTQWSATLLNMADDCESIGNLLIKAAVAYLQTDKAIAKAYFGDKAEQDKIKAEIDQANQQLAQFKQQYEQEKQTYDTVKSRIDDEKKAADKEKADAHKWDNVPAGYYGYV